MYKSFPKFLASIADIHMATFQFQIPKVSSPLMKIIQTVQLYGPRVMFSQNPQKITFAGRRIRLPTKKSSIFNQRN